MNSILFDIGATKTRIAFSADGETFEEPKVFTTVQNYEEIVSLFVATAQDLAQGREIKKIVGGMSRSIADWNEQKLKEDLSKRLGGDVFIENDSAIVGLGEASWGAGKGFEIVAYITVSTGVGGVRIVNGKIDERAIGFEPGHQIIDIENGVNKTLEEMISGKALQKKTGKHPKEITDQDVWTEHAKFLAIGLNNIIVEWSPDCIVLGGSMITGNPAIPLDKTENYLKEILKIFPELPLIKKSELGDFGGLYGALAYLKDIN
ncbi:MAG: ROK family protein [Candidatus Paceibacterota bacterium]|jgi:predicted NBD/HSP70 family sugar kinase